VDLHDQHRKIGAAQSASLDDFPEPTGLCSTRRRRRAQTWTRPNPIAAARPEGIVAVTLNGVVAVISERPTPTAARTTN